MENLHFKPNAVQPRRGCSSEDENSTLYVVKREGDRWVFLPSPTFSSLMVGTFGGGSAFLVYLSTLFFRRSGAASLNLWLGAILLLGAAFCAGLGIRAWRTRRTPLNVECGGRIKYGEREVCATGMVLSVRIAPSRGGEANDCEVRLELADGKLVAIPSQYFGAFKTRNQARPFAAKLAEALQVPVTEFR